MDTLACVLAALADSLARGDVEMDMDDGSVCKAKVHPRVWTTTGWAARWTCLELISSLPFLQSLERPM